mgnify:CR=1 FL=1
MSATHNNAGIAAWRCNLKASIGSFDDALDFLDDDYERDLGPQMVVKRNGLGPFIDYLSVVLYDTEIIRYYPDGTFSVDNGGFNTPTTRARLNMVLPRGYHAYHHKKQLGLAGNGHDYSGPTKLWPLYHSVRIEVK